MEERPRSDIDGRANDMWVNALMHGSQVIYVVFYSYRRGFEYVITPRTPSPNKMTHFWLKRNKIF